MNDLVLVASTGHPFPQVTQPFRDLWAVLYRDQSMVQR
jgi:hypothetical protein